MHVSPQRPAYISDDDEDEEEEEESQELCDDLPAYNYELSSDRSRIQTRNLKSKRASPGKNVSFQDRATKHQYDAEGDKRYDDAAADQLQRESRNQTRTSSIRPLQSMSPIRRSGSRVNSRQAPEENVNLASGSTSTSPTGLERRRSVELVSCTDPSQYTGTSDPTPPEQLTPQEKKDNELDATVMKRLDSIRVRVDKLCRSVFEKDSSLTLKGWRDWLDNIEEYNDVEFINFCRAVAEGGGDAETWRLVVANGVCRYGLGYGIIHRVLVRHVFGSLLFGAPQDLMVKLEEMEKQQENQDGFYREEQRALYITSYEIRYRVDLNKSEERKLATLRMALQITKLLRPLLELKRLDIEETVDETMQDVLGIVGAAAELATLMKKSGNTVLYQFGHVFKDQVIEPETMGILNFKELNDERNKSGGADQVLIRMVCGDPLVAFRRGGGVMAERKLAEEEKELDMSVAPELRHLARNEYRGRLITAQDGYRDKFLAKALVVGRLEQIGSKDKATDLMEAIHLLRDGKCTPQ